MSKLFVFDLDGVLIDSLNNMSIAWESVQSKFGIDTPFDEYKSHIGKPFPSIMKELGLFNRHFEIFETYKTYSRMHLDKITLFEGVYETLLDLKRHDCKIAMVTSKAKDTVSLLEDKLPKFDFISCPKKGLRGKPAPDQLLFTISMCNVDPKDTFYIGDMIFDQQCAKRAGVHFEYAEWGYGNIECKNSLKSIKDLIKLLD